MNPIAVERALLKRSLSAFVMRFWRVVTGAPLVPNRATDSIIAALQEVADGTVIRLLVAVPPGTGKTTLLALFAAWRLARDPGWRSIHAAHAFDLAATESRRVRRLVESPEYRALFPVVLRTDESTVAHWATTADGRYFAVGTDGALTGRRAHEAVLDDPLNATDRFSKAARDALWAWFTEALSTRLDGDRAPIVVVQQRLDRDDLIGRLIDAGGWTLVELPAESEDGELLAPNVLSRAKLDTLKLQVGAATYATQFLMRPSDDATAVIKRSWWRFYRPTHAPASALRPLGCGDSPAVELPESFDRIVIAADLTFGSTTGDYAAVVVWGARGGGRYLLELWRRRVGFEESLVAIAEIAARYPTAKVIVERAANGFAVIETLRKSIPGVVALRPQGSKMQRLAAISPTVESGACHLPLGAAWLSDYVEELAGATRHDDAQDATAYAVSDLATNDTSTMICAPPRLFTGDMPERSIAEPDPNFIGPKAFARRDEPTVAAAPHETLFANRLWRPF